MCKKTFAFSTEIIDQKMLAEDIFSLKLHYPKDLIKEAKAGRFVNVYLNREDLLLPRPISICKVNEEAIILVYKIVGEGTKELAKYEKGQTIKITAPLGNGYEIPTGAEEVWIIGGGLGIPPLLELASQLKKAGCSLNVVLGFRDVPFLTEEFGEFADKLMVISEASGYGLKGNVMDILIEETAKNCFASGPLPMLKAVSNYCEERDVSIQVSLEERMACGYGACLGCVCNIKEDGEILIKRVCKEGPVFDGRKVAWDA